ncbi:type 1 glutamine amidotransferase domain-containing protein [Sinorhizobium mexicanum]|uniref:Type 1 glutamine amidotransferase domain-containing protein n=1 Tax=Sinorhizobium mexicanum TaxID=375549 RepID=A0A859R261_9HYPH|nr:type 1 glutamine amidotransferase domain-containing protein [Sinorhizobium mexicanum]MBP1884375.1 putative intracellular protease/amidase [Sinorhizobium mexicanum]QLL65051.1 type 1 glutamine amidotransferase domain-containing protein [Sinorhizobium mexicanum]
MPNILIVLSVADKWTRADGSIYETGVWAEEFVVMDEVFVQTGFQVDIASPGGIAPTMDARSLDPAIVGRELADRMRNYLDENSDRMERPLVLAEVDVSRYDAVVVPGGHGPVEDLYKDPDMGRVMVAADREEKVIAAVCHGPAALLAAKDENGQWHFAGRRMTSLTDEEEIEFGTAENAPWLLADTLRKSGAIFEQGRNWDVYIVEDGNLLTGQNPASSAALADAVIAALR